MGESVFKKMHDSLLEHWKCDKHTTVKHCWKPLETDFMGKICIELSAWHLDAWARAIMDGTTTKFM